jgi:hypothetical protein
MNYKGVETDEICMFDFLKKISNSKMFKDPIHFTRFEQMRYKLLLAIFISYNRDCDDVVKYINEGIKEFNKPVRI